jgi:hypothetical protein
MAGAETEDHSSVLIDLGIGAFVVVAIEDAQITFLHALFRLLCSGHLAHKSTAFQGSYPVCGRNVKAA